MSTSQHHDDPTADGAARAAQLAAMTLSIAEGVARLRAERLAGKAADDERQAAAQRAQHRADAAARWLSGRDRPPGPGPGSPPGPDGAPPAPEGGSWAVTIVCSPQDLADQSFPVPMPAAMATAPEAARDAVQPRPALTAPRPRPALTSGPTHGTGGGGPR